MKEPARVLQCRLLWGDAPHKRQPRRQVHHAGEVETSPRVEDGLERGGEEREGVLTPAGPCLAGIGSLLLRDISSYSNVERRRQRKRAQCTARSPQVNLKNLIKPTVYLYF
jgi:hypothetical protein